MQEMYEDQMYEQMMEQMAEEQAIEQSYEDQMIEQQIEGQAIEQSYEDQMIEQQIEQMAEEQMIDQMYESQMLEQMGQGYYHSSDLAILKGASSAQFHLRRGKYEIFAFTSYLPVRFDANSDEKMARRVVYNFKDGHDNVCHEVANLVSRFIVEKYDRLEDKVFMVIPASTKSKNENRFRNFTDNICTSTNMKNEMSGISILFDRTESKGKVGVSKVKNLSFDAERFEGKHVILFDDVITSGSSFEQVANILMKNGAKQVTGLFLAKTVHK